MWWTWIQSQAWEDDLEKEMATHSSILAWRIPWKEEPGGLQSMRSQKSQTRLIDSPAAAVCIYGSTSCRSCSGIQSCLTLCDPVDCSTPGFPVLHHLPELSQTHIHGVGDAIWASRSLSSTSSPAFYLSQHQGLFQWVGFAHQVASVGASASASVLPMNVQDWFPLGLTGLISLHSKGLSRVFSSTTGKKHQFFSAQPSLPSSCYICSWLVTKSQTRPTD